MSVNSYQGTLAFTTGAGVNAMTIDANQKVLIGTAEAATVGKAIVMSMVFG